MVNQSKSSCTITTTDWRAANSSSSSSNLAEGEFLSNVPIREPGEHDVLLGRGGGTNNHSGNIKFRQLVNEHKLRYLFCPKMEKARVARDVVALWRALAPPGRFLSCRGGEKMKREPRSVQDSENEWSEVGDQKAHEKTLQCLRERTPLVTRKRQHEDAIIGNGISTIQQLVAFHTRKYIEKLAKPILEGTLGNSRGPDSVSQALLKQQCDIGPGEQRMMVRHSSMPSCNETYELAAPPYNSYPVEDATYSISGSVPAFAAEPCDNSGYSPYSNWTEHRISMPTMTTTTFVSSNSGASGLSPQGAADTYRRAAAAGVALLPEEAAHLRAVDAGTDVQSFPPSLEQTSHFLTPHNISVGCSPLAHNIDSVETLTSATMPPLFAPQSLVEAEYGSMVAEQQENNKMEQLRQQNQESSKRKKSPASLQKEVADNPRLKSIPKTIGANKIEGTGCSQEICGNGRAPCQRNNTNCGNKAASSVVTPQHSTETAAKFKKIKLTLSGDLGKMACSKPRKDKNQDVTPSSIYVVTMNAIISAAAMAADRADAVYQQQLRKFVTETTDRSLDDETFDGSDPAEELSDLDDDDSDNWEKEYEELNLGASGASDVGKRGHDRHWSEISFLTEMSGHLHYPARNTILPADGADAHPSRLMSPCSTGSSRSTLSEITDLSNFWDTASMVVK
jgi:hypothetical protein